MKPLLLLTPLLALLLATPVQASLLDQAELSGPKVQASAGCIDTTQNFPFVAVDPQGCVEFVVDLVEGTLEEPTWPVRVAGELAVVVFCRLHPEHPICNP